MQPPFLPLFSTDIETNVDIIIRYLQQLNDYLSQGEPEAGWSTSGLSVRRVLNNGDTLANTQNTLGTLIDTLKSRGIITT